MSLAENSNQVFLPVVGEHSSFLYAIYKSLSVILYKMYVRYAVERKCILQLSAIDVYD